MSARSLCLVLPLLLAPPPAHAGWYKRAYGDDEAEPRPEPEVPPADQEDDPATAMVEEVVDEHGVAVDGRAPLVLSREQRELADSPGGLDPKQIYWLKPRAGLLPPNPEATTDFTAYTLRAGEVKVGLLSVGVGIFDNLQLSTMPLAFYVGLPNASLKVDAVQAGPLDLAVTGERFWLTQDGFHASYTGVGAVASLRLFPAWSVHGGASYAGVAAKGVPDECQLNAILTDGLQCEATPAEHAAESAPNPLGLAGNDVYGEVLWVRAATDIRFNRRDSIILQVATVPFARLQVDESMELPDIAQLDEVLAFDGKVPLGTLYVASAAWQFAWKNAHLRVGLGSSTVPMAWLSQTTELSVRLGGRDRVERSRQKRAWRRNQRDLRDGRNADEEQAASPEADQVAQAGT